MNSMDVDIFELLFGPIPGQKRSLGKTAEVYICAGAIVAFVWMFSAATWMSGVMNALQPKQR